MVPSIFEDSFLMILFWRCGWKRCMVHYLRCGGLEIAERKTSITVKKKMNHISKSRWGQGHWLNPEKHPGQL